MKKILLILAFIFYSGANVWGQTTYTWNVSSGSWATASSWSPERTLPATNDILVFDGSIQATPTVTSLPSTQTIGKIILQNNVTADFSASAVSAITIGGGDGTDLVIPSGSELRLTGTIAITINIGTGATGSIGGTFRIPGTQTAPHRLIPSDASSLTVLNGGVIIQGNATGSSFTGNLFGNSGTASTVIFQSGSAFYQRQGSNPFALGQPSSKVIFQSGSTYYYYLGGTPTTSGRTYANLVFGNGQAPSNTGSVTADWNIENLTLEAGTSLNYNTTGTGKVYITGNITQSSNLTGMTLGAGGGVFLNGSGTQTIGGAGSQSLTFPKTTTISSSSSVVLNRNIVVTGSMIVDGSINLGNRVISGTAGNFTLSAGATLKSASATGINGNITVTGTTSLNAEANYEYNGSSAQVTGALLPSTINNLTINNGEGVTLSGSNKVNGTLTLTNSLFKIGDNILTLGPSATISGTPSATNMIVADYANCEVRKEFSSNPGASFTFPIGDNTNTAEYSPMTLTSLTADGYSSAYVGVRVVDEKHPSNTSTTDYLNRYWVVTSSGLTNPTYSARFSYTDDDINGTEDNIYGAKYSSSWTILDQATSGSNYFSGTNLNSFSDFTGGENGALPIELSSINILKNGNSVNLNWTTKTEVNSHQFLVERKANNNWEVIGEVKASGNSNSVKEYSFTDKYLVAGKYSYRLKMVDNDGSFEYSKEAEVEIELPNEFNLSQNYPNPFNPSTIISYQLPSDSKVVLELFAVTGEKIATLVNDVQSAGQYNYPLSITDYQLSSGTYIYRLVAGDFVSVKKMVVLK